MHERIEIVFFKWVSGLHQEREVYVVSLLRILGVEFIGEEPSSTDDDDSAIGDNLVARIPSPVLERARELNPIARIVITGGESANHAFTFSVTAGLDESAVGVEGAGGAPGVGEDEKRAGGRSWKRCRRGRSGRCNLWV